MFSTSSSNTCHVQAARELLTLEDKDPKRLFEGNALLRRLIRLGVLDESQMKLDYVLGLRTENFMERRLQTQVCSPLPHLHLLIHWMCGGVPVSQ